LEYTDAGKLQLDVATIESFAIDVFMQFAYRGNYDLAKAIALSHARKVPETLVHQEPDAIPVSFLFRGHLEIYHLSA
jgi:hypothetical protein